MTMSVFQQHSKNIKKESGGGDDATVVFTLINWPMQGYKYTPHRRLVSLVIGAIIRYFCLSGESRSSYKEQIPGKVDDVRQAKAEPPPLSTSSHYH